MKDRYDVDEMVHIVGCGEPHCGKNGKVTEVDDETAMLQNLRLHRVEFPSKDFDWYTNKALRPVIPQA